MNKNDKLNKLLEKDFVFLDGAMGTMLQKMGLKPGEKPETLCMTRPELITEIHKMYIEKGSNIIYANTFSANRKKLAGTGFSVDEIIKAAVGAAREAASGTDTLVALDCGPVGELLEPSGALKFEDAYDIFKEMMIAGSEAGADLVVIETMTDLYEVKAAVLAAKENTDLPVIVTMSFEKDGRTFTGCSIESMATVLEGLGVQAMGINCSLGPDLILPMARELSEYTDLPIVIKANAGLPDPETGAYDIGPEEYAGFMKDYAKIGIRFIGGCCGTSPDYIGCVKEVFSGLEPVRREKTTVSRVCTPTKAVRIDGVRVIGERINPTGKKRFQQALRENDLDYILAQAIAQADAGADILDVNVGLPDIDEPEMMVRVVKAIQSVVDLPLQIDSSDPKAIEAGLRVVNGKAIVNSVNGDEAGMEKILPIVKKYGASVVGLTLDPSGVPDTAEKRFELAQKIMNKALGYGIKKEDIFIDCLTLTVSAQQEQAMETLKALKRVKDELGLNTVLGVSNISFGLPYRELINQTFLTMAMNNGLTLPIINPNIDAMMNAVFAFNVLSGKDEGSGAYIERFADGAHQPVAAPAAGAASAVPSGSAGGTGGASGAASASGGANDAQNGCKEGAGKFLYDEMVNAVLKGMKRDVRDITTALLESKTELEIIDEYLIPALDEAGAGYEKGKLFLPQLLNAANASQEAFEIIKERISSSGAEPVTKGKIILATVKGDIHDIGKNIVKVILENYGFGIRDLGKDVAPEAVVEAAMAENADIVGLSALMTTTLKSMEDTIAALKAAGYRGKTMVGGAVLTPDYARKIGADFYAADAKESADIAKMIIG